MTSTIEESPAQAARHAARAGGPEGVLAPGDVVAFIREQLGAQDLDGRSVCLVVPDGTRTCPLPFLLAAVHGALHGRVSRLTTVIALGSHAAMDEERLAAHLGYAVGGSRRRTPA